MNVCEKVKTIDNKTEQSKAHYYLDRQTAKVSVLSSGNVGKCDFLTGAESFAATVKSFEHSPLGIDMKKQTDITNKNNTKA